MDYTTKISLDVLISLISGIIGAVGAYVKLKSKIDVLEKTTEHQTTEITDLKERKKEMNTALHKRIDDQNAVINDIEKNLSAGHSKLETAIANLELRIVREIQNMIKQIRE
jgi:septal ring factor EnvC (AmiA/AmiB activator)